MEKSGASDIRLLKIKDLIAVHKLYSSLSPQSQKCYNSLIYGKPKSLIWFPAQIALIISHTPLRNILLKVYSKYLYFILGAFDKSNNLIGFAHFVLYPVGNKLTARIGIAIKDNFQGQGIASCLLSDLIDLAVVNSVDEFFLDVFPQNQRAINLYKKHGFKIIRRKEGRDHNKNLVEIYEMGLPLNQSDSR